MRFDLLNQLNMSSFTKSDTCDSIFVLIHTVLIETEHQLNSLPRHQRIAGGDKQPMPCFGLSWSPVVPAMDAVLASKETGIMMRQV